MSRLYQIELTEEQLKALSKASELFARIRIGQADTIIWKVFPDVNGTSFASAMLDRGVAELRGKPGNSSSEVDWSEDARILWDLHQTFRHRLWWDNHPDFPKTHSGNVDS